MGLELAVLPLSNVGPEEARHHANEELRVHQAEFFSSPGAVSSSKISLRSYCRPSA